MKVTDKKFLNVHQTIGPLTVSTTVTSSAKEEGSTKSEKLLVSLRKSSAALHRKCFGTDDAITLQPASTLSIMHGTFKHYHIQNNVFDYFVASFPTSSNCCSNNATEKER